MARDLDELVDIRMRVSIAGLFEGCTDVKAGDVVPAARRNAERYFKLGYCQPAHIKELGRPYEPFDGAA